ncbi:MAG: menaquinone biosynthesis protein [Desulfuromonadales bacterium]|nr:menaquinone biosynthesis protein [Desulfuromonadales bacterium]
MNSMTELALGYIPYLNCVPYYHYLKQCGFQGKYISGVPSVLNRMLQNGELDVSPSSSFEYARNWRNYLLLPDHSISSIGEVKSVLLFSPVPLAELSGRKVAITGESATSINLLRVILREFYHLQNVTDIVPTAPIEKLIKQYQPALLIGDRALSLAGKKPKDMYIFDLGDIWYQHTGLPFVFALWMVSRSALNNFADELNALNLQLKQSYGLLMQQPNPVAATFVDSVGLNISAIVDYWETIDYRLDKDHLKGLQLFYQLCNKHSLLSEIPDLDFFY